MDPTQHCKRTSSGKVTKMHKATLIACIVLGLAAMIHAQGNCPGRAEEPNCSLQPSRGHRRGSNCQWRAGRVWVWHARSRTCEPLHYLGCGGNSNRFCTRQACERRCDRRRPSTRRTTRRSTRRTTEATEVTDGPTEASEPAPAPAPEE